MQRERGYIGLLMLFIGTAILVYLYMQYSPLKLVTPLNSATSTTEAQMDIQAAQQVKDMMEVHTRETNQMLQQ